MFTLTMIEPKKQYNGTKTIIIRLFTPAWGGYDGMGV
jgi:hypothetical protein